MRNAVRQILLHQKMRRRQARIEAFTRLPQSLLQPHDRQRPETSCQVATRKARQLRHRFQAQPLAQINMPIVEP